MAVVDGRGFEPISCTPVVYESMTNCGVGLFCEDGSGRVWGPAVPRDLIVSWRATELLRRFRKIEGNTLAKCYYCATRRIDDPDRQRHIGELVIQIGQAAYDEIMALAVPEEIVQAILDNQQSELSPDLHPITDEVRAGTIKWREEFATVGIKHPDAVDAEIRKNKETIARYENLLVSFAQSHSMGRQCIGMGNVEGALLTIITKGAEQRHSMAVIVALAGVVGKVANSELAIFLMPPRAFDFDMARSHLEKAKENGLTQSAEWLAENCGHSWWKFWQPAGESFSFKSAKDLLGRLLREYFPEQTAAMA